MYMSHLDKNRFRMFYCAIDLEAWRKLKVENYDLPEPVEMCNEFVSEFVLRWYFFTYPGIVGSVRYFFDRNEPFKGPFENKWNAEKDRAEDLGAVNEWSLLEEVAAVDMRMVPGIQAADILAWSVNREKTAIEGLPGSARALLMKQIIPSYSVEWDEKKMKEKYKPRVPRIVQS